MMDSIQIHTLGGSNRYSTEMGMDIDNLYDFDREALLY